MENTKIEDITVEKLRRVECFYVENTLGEDIGTIEEIPATKEEKVFLLKLNGENLSGNKCREIIIIEEKKAIKVYKEFFSLESPKLLQDVVQNALLQLKKQEYK